MDARRQSTSGWGWEYFVARSCGAASVSFCRASAQRAVDQPGGALVGIGLCLFDGLIDGGGDGDLVQKQDLIRAEAQNIEHNRLQLCKRRGDHLRQIKVQQQPVLHHAVHEPRGQRRVAAAEAVAGDILFECAVGPGILPPDGDKRRKRRSFLRS